MKWFKKSFAVKMVMLIFIPLVLLFTLVLLVSIQKVSGLASDMAEDKMRSVCLSITDSYLNLVEGDWSYDGTNLYKGADIIGNEVLDTLNSQEGINLTIFWGRQRVLTTMVDSYGNRIVGTNANEDVVQRVLIDGQDYSAGNVVISGSRYYTYYTPIRNSDGSIVGMIYAGVDEDLISKQVGTVIVSLVIIGLVIFALAVVSAAISLVFILKGIHSAEKALTSLSEGTLEVEVVVAGVNREDDLGRLARGIEKVAGKLREITDELENTGKHLNDNAGNLVRLVDSTVDSVGQVNTAMNEVAQGSTEQANSIGDAMAQISEMGNSLMEMSSMLNMTFERMNVSADYSDKAKQTMIELVNINNETKSSIDAIVTQSNLNVESIKKIGGIVASINDIASQTNLLSLNASIEAARAGEAGKGFSVVAEEIGKLAQESSKASSDIKAIIEALVKDIDETAVKAKVLNSNATMQVSKLKETSKEFEQVVEGIGSAHKSMETVLADVKSVKSNKDKVGLTIESLSAISEENAASSEETAASSSIIETSVNSIKVIADEIDDASVKIDSLLAFFR